MKLIVGLGNPGAEYAGTRHNIGWDVLDALGWDSSWEEKKFGGRLFRAGELLFLKPLTYMNSSGDSVGACAGFYKLRSSDVIVIHDDMDIPLGDVRVKATGGHGGHRGVKSVIERLGTPDFVRVKCGIGRPAEGVEVLAHVLSVFRENERPTVQEMVTKAAVVVGHQLKKDEPEASCEEKNDPHGG